MKPDYDEMLYEFLQKRGLHSAWIHTGEVTDDPVLSKNLARYCTMNVKCSFRRRVVIGEMKSEYIRGCRKNRYRISIVR